MAALVSAAQLGAAVDGISYVGAALSEQGIRVDPQFDVDPGALVGMATTVDLSAYGSMEAMLYGSVVHARSGSAESVGDRLALGERFLQTAVWTQVADAGRMGAALATGSRPRVGYVRVVNPPCCQRCAVLAGKWSAEVAFPRHPGCDCTSVPTTESADHRGLVEDVGPEHIKDLTRGQRLAIEDGADMNQVINSHRAGQRFGRDGMWTREGTTKRAYATHVRQEVARLRGRSVTWSSEQVGRRGAVANYTVRRLGPRATPDAIYRYAPTREEAIRALHAEGYIVGDIKSIARLGA